MNGFAQLFLNAATVANNVLVPGGGFGVALASVLFIKCGHGDTLQLQ